MKATGIFVILQGQDCFKCNPEKVPNKHFIKSVQKQPCTDVLKNFIQVFSHEYCKIFKNSAFIENLWWMCFLSVWLSNCSVLGICRPSFLNQKHNVGWFLLKRFVDLFRVHYIIHRNYFTTFLLIHLLKTKPCPK